MTSAGVLVEVHQPGAPRLLVVVLDRLVVGRDAEGLLLRDPKVSRRHAELRIEPDGLAVVDLESTNGTFVNGTPVGDVPVPIGPDDRLLVGGTELVALGPVTLDARVRSDIPATTPTPINAGSTPSQQARVAPAGRVTSIRRLAEAARADDRSFDALVKRGSTVTILFSDIESSTEHATRLGDVEWFRLLARHDRRVRDVVAQYRGIVVKHQGDGFMVSFDSATQGVLCSIAIQQAVSDANSDEAALGLRLRIGVHTGEALRLGDEDWIGRHVIIASRIADAAEGGRILVSTLVWELTRARTDLPYGDPLDLELKGLGEQSVREVAWWKRSTT